MLKLTGKKLTALAAAALTTLTISATAFAAAFTSADAQSMAAKLVPASASHVGTQEDFNEYEFKFFDNATATSYEVEISKLTQSVKEYKMEARTILGSRNIVLSAADAQAVVTKEYPNFHKVKLDMDDGLYEYELKFTTPELRGEMVLNPETGAVLEKELRYNVR
mgnify:CR=1 FL=1